MLFRSTAHKRAVGVWRSRRECPRNSRATFAIGNVCSFIRCLCLNGSLVIFASAQAVSEPLRESISCLIVSSYSAQDSLSRRKRYTPCARRKGYGVPAGSRTRNYALGGRRYIHLTTETYSFSILFLRAQVK